jgi:adenosylhomocysteine nucleosidase
VAAGATALISFGLAGGLDPALPAGTLVIPEAVLEGATRTQTNPALSARFGGPTHATALATRAILATPAEKHAAFRATGAAIVDLESGAVARVATRHALPFAVIRAICDPAAFALPPLALTALDPAGRITPSRVLSSLLRHPAQLPALLALARHAARARARLSRLTSESPHP